jgi:prephenate dehydrogenase
VIRSMIVVGTGLIGTSVALAARRADVTVFLADRDLDAVRIAQALGAGLAQAPPERVDLAVLAVPPSAVGPVLCDAQVAGIASAYTDVASVKGEPERVALRLAPEPAAYVGGHPMAGLERSGPLAARADLFAGRPWVLTPSAVTSRSAIERVEALVTLCDAVPVVLASRAHDDAVALISHVPHLVASLMAARLAAGTDGTRRLAGQGVRDVTRIAAGDPGLWSDIIQANAHAILPVLRDLGADLGALVCAVEELTRPDADERVAGRRAVTELLERGTVGVSRTWRPESGSGDEPASRLRVRLDAVPGGLARLLALFTSLSVDTAQVEVDVDAGGGIEVRIGCAAGTAEHVAAGLRSAGWKIA